MSHIEISKIRLYESFLRDIINEIVQKIDKEKLQSEEKLFLTKIKEGLCMDSNCGWKFFTSSLDIIGDSQLAINSFLSNKINEFEDIGNSYLKLYGVLSAAYIQQQAILKISDLVKIKQLTKLKDSFDNLEVTFLRHAISAHPVNFNNNGNKASYKIDRFSMNDYTALHLRDDNNEAKIYNVFISLNEYILLAESCLENACKKLISNCYKTSISKLNKLNYDLNSIKHLN